MSKDRHSFTVGECQEDHFGKHDGPATIGVIAVKPPIVTGPLFERAVLGNVPYKVSLEHVVSTQDATSFLAECWEPNTSVRDRVTNIHSIGTRIVWLANNPDDALSMMYQDFGDELIK